jgi:hypothetical protein
VKALEIGRPTAGILADARLRATDNQSSALCASDYKPCGNFPKGREVSR